MYDIRNIRVFACVKKWVEKMKKITIILFILVLAVFSYSSLETFSMKTEDMEPVAADEATEELQQEPVFLHIIGVGDIMTHGPQLRAQYVEKGVYDFSDNYEIITPIIDAADLALCNVETVFAGEEQRYSSYPMFNTPDSLVEALRAAGFDIAVTSNNHCLDRGSEGVIRTIDVIRDNGLEAVGTQLKDEHKFLIYPVEGIKVGIAAYTYETPKYRNSKTINGLVIPEEMEGYINTFNYDNLDEDLMEMSYTIEEMRAGGAQIIIFYLHWGQEYNRTPDEYQKRIAGYLAENDVDILFGSHPHVIQPVEIIEDKEGEKTVVFYSLGNFISNQRYELMGFRYSEDGMIGEVILEFDPEKQSGNLLEVNCIPTWVNKYYADGNKYEIVPLPQFIQKENLSEETLWRAENSFNNTLQIIGPKYLNEETMELEIYRKKLKKR